MRQTPRPSPNFWNTKFQLEPISLSIVKQDSKMANTSYHIATLLEKMLSTDKDFRFMATNDLMTELQVIRALPSFGIRFI